MHHRKNNNRRFRHRSSSRNHHSRNNGGDNPRLGSATFLNGRIRNWAITIQGAEKLIEKYNLLAKEALTSGDRTLSENYYQHADHFMRIIDEAHHGGTKAITLASRGEPTLHPQFGEM